MYLLGQIFKSPPTPKAFLVTLNSVSTVTDILSNYSSPLLLVSNLIFSILKESILLKEHRALVNDNISRNSIKLSGNHIFVKERLHARVLHGVLVRGHDLGDYSDELQGLSGDATQGSPSSSTPNQPSTVSSTSTYQPPATSSIND